MQQKQTVIQLVFHIDMALSAWGLQQLIQLLL